MKTFVGPLLIFFGVAAITAAIVVRRGCCLGSRWFPSTGHHSVSTSRPMGVTDDDRVSGAGVRTDAR